MSPSVSAVVTAYNAERHIGETLAAILAQTRPPDEVIVVDDGSTDGTRDVLRELGSAVRTIRQPNGGHANALNRGCRAARGDYLAKCDADDLWQPDKLERQLAALDADPGIDVAFGAVWIFGLEESRWDVPGGSYGVLDHERFAKALFDANLICPSSTLLRRSLYERLGPFVEHLPAEDYDYWLRALAVGARFHYDPRVLVRYRRHDAQITANLLAVRRAAFDVRQTHRDLVDDRAHVDAVLARELRAIGRMLVDEGEPRAARSAYRASLRRRATPAALAWTALLAAPAAQRRRLIDLSLALRRGATPGGEASSG